MRINGIYVKKICIINLVNSNNELILIIFLIKNYPNRDSNTRIINLIYFKKNEFIYLFNLYQIKC